MITFSLRWPFLNFILFFQKQVIHHLFLSSHLLTLVFHPELVFKDRVSALKVAKGIKGSRFKCFNNLEDAVKFSHSRVPPTAEVQNGEKDSRGQFPSLHPRELAILRKSIEKGDQDSLEIIRTKIWSNPNFLISLADSAVYLMAGPKYNAAHIACKADQGKALSLILETVTNEEFVKKMYPKDPDDLLRERMGVLLDSYLNTPDKVVSSKDNVHTFSELY